MNDNINTGGPSPLQSAASMTDTPSGLKAVTVARDFKLEFLDNRSAAGAVIYANSENKVGIRVSVKLTHDGNPVNITDVEFLHNLFLYDKATGNPLSWQQSPPLTPLIYSDVPGDFTRAVRYTPSLTGETTCFAENDYTHSFTFYVYCLPGTGQLFDLYARLAGLNTTVPEFADGYIDTSGSFSFLPQSIKQIQAIPAIDYSQSQNWTVQYSDWVSKGNIDILSCEKISPEWQNDEWVVESRYRKLSLIIKNYDESHSLKFKYRDITGDIITDPIGKTYKTTLRARPSSFFGWGYYNEHYDVIAWWVEPGLPGRHTPGYNAVGYVGSECELQAANHYYLMKINDYGKDLVHQSADNVSDDAITLYQWDLRYENTYIYPCNWSDITHDAFISVCDIYGNHGKLKITFPSDQWDAEIHYGG